MRWKSFECLQDRRNVAGRGIGFDTTSGKQILDVVNLSDHSNVYLA